jgi:3-phenylpropionate/cinnamic acid dioxygenase small subunit
MSNANTPTDQELVDFVYAEARLLDEGRFDEWYELFTEDGAYWIPLEHDQPDPIHHTSLVYDDRLLMQVRLGRMKSPRAFSLRPPVRCHHLLAQPRVERREDDNGLYLTRTDFLYTEAQGDKVQQYAATAYHELTQVDGQLRMRLKRVNLLNCEAAHPAVQLYL